MSHRHDTPRLGATAVPGLSAHSARDTNRRGVCYDVGRSFGGPSTRPAFDVRIVQRELAIIRHELHCNAVRICGAELDRIERAAKAALREGLEVWLCPELFEHDPNQTLGYIATAARSAESLRRKWPGRVVLSVGTELTFFMPGILEGTHFRERIAAPTFFEQIASGAPTAALNAFLQDANAVVRRSFKGPVTYASAPLETVDWSMFDFVCVDAYRDARTAHSFDQILNPYLLYDRPVVVSETGCCTYRGADAAGGMGWAIVDYAQSSPRLDSEYTRDEALQARELIDVLDSLRHQGRPEPS